MAGNHVQSPAFRRLSRFPVVLACALTLCGGAEARDTLDLVFRPPDIKAEPICVSPPTDDETTDFWGHWDGRVLPDRPVRSIRRDMTRLTQIDGARWFDTTARAMDLLEKLDPAFTGQTALLMRIAALDAAGKYEELTRGGMVVQLATLAEPLKPASKLVLARYLRDGIGIEADPALADVLLSEAGYSGDPKALLALAARQLDGKAPADWVVPVELAVTTAFSNMVGELDPTICDRTTRIATEFRLGRIVTPDPQLAHDWYRFTADLGGGHAAWKVVEYHMRAEGFEKSNDLLLRYLEQAAAADLSYAQIELARVLERGALADMDLGRAHDLYAAAAESGDLRGLSQFALFLGRHEDHDPGWHDARRAVLHQLIARNDAPGWAFARLAEFALQDSGRWAGAADARVLLEQGVERGNLDSRVLLARLIMADAPNAADIDRAVDLLAVVVDKRGGAQPMTLIRGAHVCRRDVAPDRAAADYWLDRVLAIGASDADESTPLLRMRMDSDGPRLAEIQSFALSGSPDGLVMWRRIIQAAPFADDAMRAFWVDYFVQTDERLVAQARLDLTLTGARAAQDAIFAALRDRHRSSGPGFAALLNRTLVTGMYGPDAQAGMSEKDRAAAADLLARSAGLGLGRAMAGLAALTPDAAERRAIFERFREVIERDGDFAAQLFAARYGDAADRYMMRAAGVMPCNFGAAMEMAELSRDMQDDARVARWLDVADVLATERTSWMIALARVYFDSGDAGKVARALELLTLAGERGDTRADRELFRLIVTPGTPVFDPDRAAGMIAKALEDGRIGVLGGYLSAYRKADPATRNRIEAQLDMPRVYRVAAESGDPLAMRIHGIALRERAEGAGALAEAMDWLTRAAEGGDTVAMTELGEALAFGIGVAADRDGALDWLERAAEQGSDRAREITRLVALTAGAGQ